MQEINPEPSWPFAKRIAFRFAFAYSVLYILPFPAQYFPFISYLAQAYINFWHAIVPWVSQNLLHLSYDITVFENGSGDTTYNYVQILCLLTLAAAATVVWSMLDLMEFFRRNLAASAASVKWSVLDRRRLSYERLHQWLSLYVRFWLASAMIGYGAFKIIPVQMPAPFLARLVEQYGDSSPMGLLWTFIGASKGFEIFTGCAEMLGGVLLILPRTTMLGALICLADTTQIFILNMCYDVPVKLLSLHLLVSTVFLIAPDLKRLANLFFLNRGVGPVRPFKLFQRARLNRVALAVQIIFALYIIGWSFFGSYRQSKVYGDGAPRPPLYGIWSAEEFSVEGQVRPPLLTDTTRWQRAIFGSQGSLTIQPMNGPNQFFSLDLNIENKKMLLGKWDDPNWKADFSFEELGPGLIALEGKMDGHRTKVKLVRVDESKFLLKSRGFHWIQETPFNR